jgi:septum formation protein
MIIQGFWVLLSLSLQASPVLSFASRTTVTLAASALNMSNSDSGCSQEPPTLIVSNLKHLGNNEDNKIRLILASQSPRRRDILDMLGLSGLYIAMPSPLDESTLQSDLVNTDEPISPIEYTQILAEKKAEALAHSLSQDVNTKSTLVLGSDTIVDLDGVILEKPTDSQAAMSMLSRLSGKWHKVHTGVAIYHVESTTKMNLVTSFTETAAVKFAPLSEQDIISYVATGEPMDKAGSYGIQGVGGQFVERMEGDYFCVMGLPMHRTSRELSRVISELVK